MNTEKILDEIFGEEDLRSDDEKAVDYIFDMMQELDGFAKNTIDLDVETPWVAHAIQMVRLFRVELEFTLKQYVKNDKLSEEDLMKQEEQANMLKSLERHRQDMLNDCSQWRD